MSRQLQPGDRVRYTVEGVVTDLDDHGVVAMVKVDDESRSHYVPRAATVEVLEPADDPKVGELRREDHDNGHSIWQAHEDRLDTRTWLCVWSNWPGNRCVHLPWDWENVRSWPVVGAVPGTPAAEAQTPLAGPRSGVGPA